VYGSSPADIDELKVGIQEEIKTLFRRNTTGSKAELPNSCAPQYSTKWLSSK
jgi:hypothetical protein